MNKTCKYCGKESYGRPFCVECGKKYFGFNVPLDNAPNDPQSEPKEKETINITDPTRIIETKIVIQKNNDNFFDSNKLQQYNLVTENDEYFDIKYKGKRIYKCKNGNMVRSKSERTISDFLTEHNIEHAYEKPIRINSYKYNTLHPDFYIPFVVTHTKRFIKNIYIEHWGLDKKHKDYQKYIKIKKEKIEIYKKLGITLICTDEKDMIDPQKSLVQKILNVVENQVNYE